MNMELFKPVVVLILLILCICCFSATAHCQIDLDRNTKGILPPAKGGTPVTRRLSWNVDSPGTLAPGKSQISWAAGVTIKKISCDVDTGTASIQFDVRDAATPNSSGGNVLGSPLSCGTSRSSSAALAQVVNADQSLALTVTGSTGSPTVVRIYIDYEFN
jgi:hypothetical protein